MTLPYKSDFVGLIAYITFSISNRPIQQTLYIAYTFYKVHHVQLLKCVNDNGNHIYIEVF